jgi:hypothetical protein
MKSLMSLLTMVAGPLVFTTVDGMPAVQQEVSYSCGAKSLRTYQAGDLVNVEWIRPIRAILRITPDLVIEHREVQLLNHHYLNK